MQGGGPIGVFVDANVWFSRTLRDWIGLLYVTPDEPPFVVHWTEDVLAELLYHLRKTHPMWSGGRVSGIRDQLAGTFEAGRVDAFEIDGSYGGDDTGDAHVHAAALACGAGIEDTVVEALLASEIIAAKRTATAGRWEISHATRVGVVTVGGVQVTVTPKVRIDRLVFMLGYARDPAYWRDTDVELESHADLPEALAHALVRHARAAMWRGVLQGYRQVDDTTTVLRGRIRDADQIRRWFGRLVPLEVTYDDYTADIPENQIILTAALRLLRSPGIAPATRRTLHQLRVLLADVTPLVDGTPLPTWNLTRLNQRYAPALAVAELVLRSTSFEQRHGDVRVSGFLVSMHKIFEDFVCGALRPILERAGGRARLQYGTHLDDDQAVSICPDLVWERHGSARAVVDAKYKAEKPAGFPQADLYQLLAYCTALGLTDGHLVYARGEEEPRVHQIRNSPIRIHCHALDLNTAPRELLNQVEVVGTRIAALAGPAVVGVTAAV